MARFQWGDTHHSETSTRRLFSCDKSSTNSSYHFLQRLSDILFKENT